MPLLIVLASSTHVRPLLDVHVPPWHATHYGEAVAGMRACISDQGTSCQAQQCQNGMPGKSAIACDYNQSHLQRLH